MKAKAKVLDVLHLTGRTASTEDSRTILSEKEFKELLRQLKEGGKRSEDSFSKTKVGEPQNLMGKLSHSEL